VARLGALSGVGAASLGLGSANWRPGRVANQRSWPDVVLASAVLIPIDSEGKRYRKVHKRTHAIHKKGKFQNRARDPLDWPVLTRL